MRSSGPFMRASLCIPLLGTESKPGLLARMVHCFVKLTKMPNQSHQHTHRTLEFRRVGYSDFSGWNANYGTVESKQKSADYPELFLTLKQKGVRACDCSTPQFFLGYTQRTYQQSYSENSCRKFKHVLRTRTHFSYVSD